VRPTADELGIGPSTVQAWRRQWLDHSGASVVERLSGAPAPWRPSDLYPGAGVRDHCARLPGPARQRQADHSLAPAGDRRAGYRPRCGPARLRPGPGPRRGAAEQWREQHLERRQGQAERREPKQVAYRPLAQDCDRVSGGHGKLLVPRVVDGRRTGAK
jgi:transposase-like protein